MWGSVWFGGGEAYCPLIAEVCSASACSANEEIGAPNWGSSADEAHELLFDDHARHALHFGEASGEGGGGSFVGEICGLGRRWMYGLIAISRYIQGDDFLNGLFRQFLAGRGEKFFYSGLVTRVQITSERAE